MSVSSSGPNRSAAVMQQRLRDDVPDPLDYYPTPPWATRALCEWLAGEGGEPLEIQRAWEPACGELHMARPLAEYFAQVTATDVYRYTPDHGIHDFLDELAPSPVPDADWIISNPPFVVGDRFVHRALQRARRGVAMFVRVAFGEGADRYETLFHPEARPTAELTFSERVVLLKGRLIRANAPDPFSLDDAGVPRKASTATAYCWLIWRHGEHDTRKRWIRPGTRQLLERAGDYPDYTHLFPTTEGTLL